MSPDRPPTEPSAEALARRLLALRENSGIRLDRDGHFWHRGVKVDHAGLAAAFHRWLSLDDAGRWVLRTDRDWCVVEVEDAPLVVRSLSFAPGGISLCLSDGSTAPLDPATLWQAAEDNVLYCEVAREGGGWRARFSRPAYYQLAERFEAGADGQPVLPLGGRRYSLRTASRK